MGYKASQIHYTLKPIYRPAIEQALTDAGGTHRNRQDIINQWSCIEESES